MYASMYGCMYVCTFIYIYIYIYTHIYIYIYTYALIEMIMVGGKLSRGEYVLLETWGECPGGICPGESVQRASVRGKVSRENLSVPRGWQSYFLKLISYER